MGDSRIGCGLQVVGRHAKVELERLLLAFGGDPKCSLEEYTQLGLSFNDECQWPGHHGGR